MARIKETFNSRSWFMIECDDPNCEQRFDDSQWYAYEDDLLADAKDEGWQILYKDEHPELERDMHYCPAHRLPECSTCTNIMIDPPAGRTGNVPNASRRRSRLNGHDFTREQNMEARIRLAARDRRPVESGLAGRTLRDGRPVYARRYRPVDDHPRRIRHRTEEEPLSFSPWLKTGGLRTCAADRYEAETWLDKQIGEDE